MLTRYSVDGIQYKVLEKPREIKVFKKGKEVDIEKIASYSFENRLDLEIDIFEEAENKIRTVGGKNVEMHECVCDGYDVQIYREILVMDKDELDV